MNFFFFEFSIIRIRKLRNIHLNFLISVCIIQMNIPKTLFLFLGKNKNLQKMFLYTRENQKIKSRKHDKQRNIASAITRIRLYGIAL